MRLNVCCFRVLKYIMKLQNEQTKAIHHRRKGKYHFSFKKGEKNSDIANELGVGHSTISNILKAERPW